MQIHQNYWPRVTALHDESDAVTARLSSTVSNLMSQRSDTLLQHLQEDSENVNNRTQQLQGHLATLRQAQSTTAFDMATSVSNMCQGLEVQSTSLAEETSRHQLHSAQLIQDGVEGSSQISSHVGQSLQLQETHASGHTPEKRSWPTFQDSEARPSKRKRQAGTTPSGSPVKLANVSPNKPPASTSKHVMPASKSTKSGLTVFSDKSNAFATEKSSALDAIIDANLRKPKTISSTSSEAPNRSPIKSFR